MTGNVFEESARIDDYLFRIVVPEIHASRPAIGMSFLNVGAAILAGSDPQLLGASIGGVISSLAKQAKAGKAMP